MPLPSVGNFRLMVTVNRGCGLTALPNNCLFICYDDRLWYWYYGQPPCIAVLAYQSTSIFICYGHDCVAAAKSDGFAKSTMLLASFCWRISGCRPSLSRPIYVGLRLPSAALWCWMTAASIKVGIIDFVMISQSSGRSTMYHLGVGLLLIVVSV